MCCRYLFGRVVIKLHELRHGHLPGLDELNCMFFLPLGVILRHDWSFGGCLLPGGYILKLLLNSLFILSRRDLLSRFIFDLHELLCWILPSHDCIKLMHFMPFGLLLCWHWFVSDNRNLYFGQVRCFCIHLLLRVSRWYLLSCSFSLDLH